MANAAVHLEWKFMDMIHMFLLIRHGDCRAIFITRKTADEIYKECGLYYSSCARIGRYKRYDQQRRFISLMKKALLF